MSTGECDLVKKVGQKTAVAMRVGSTVGLGGQPTQRTLVLEVLELNDASELTVERHRHLRRTPKPNLAS